MKEKKLKGQTNACLKLKNKIPNHVKQGLGVEEINYSEGLSDEYIIKTDSQILLLHQNGGWTEKIYEICF